MYDFLTGYTLVQEIGGQGAYSNLGMGFLGHLLELRSGKSYEELIITRICKPLGMTSSNTSVTASLEDPRLATCYLWDDEKQIHEHQPMRVLDAIGPAGAINSNVADMARLVRFQPGRAAFKVRRALSAVLLG